MKKKQKDNLAKLATYLEALPADYDQFDMDDYNRRDGAHLHLDHRSYECGTVACAVGHGPAAGIRVYSDGGGWRSYAERVFGVEQNGYDHRGASFDFMFSAKWVNYDNTPAGVAARIRTFLANGCEVPQNWTYEDPT